MLHQLNAIQPLSEQLWERLTTVLDRMTLKRNAHLYRPGQVANYFFFVESGLIRRYHHTEEKEITSAFYKEGDLLSSMTTFSPEIREQEYCQALEHSILYCLTYRDLQLVCRDFPEFNFHLKELMARNAQLNEECLNAIRSQRAADRYKWLMERLPDLIQRVPPKHLASYIGIAEAMLSRVKGCRV
ncbi:MAG: Crp/Fnr family transcriptional regulator [Puia sp.]|nr:Crp/Fnr family transcriptional regulator [Puia sp.]